MKKEHVQGIIFIILAGFFFALMTLLVKLAGDLPTMQKAFFRNAVAVVVAFVILAKSEDGFKVKKGSWPGLLARSVCGCIGLVSNFYAIDRMNLADSNILNKLSPFFAIMMSVIILKEKANGIEWLSVLVAFIGAIFIVKPTAGVASIPGLVGLLGGLGAGVAYTFVRYLGKRGERGPVIVMCFSLFTSLFTLPFMLMQYKPMSLKQLFIMLLAGISATGGQLCITKAYTKAPAREISVFDYTQILFAALFGLVFFGEIPDRYSLIGYVIIIGTAIFKWQYNLRQAEE